MATAQRRDAAAKAKFHFRKDVYPPGRSGTSSVASSSGACSPTDGSLRKKDKKMRNCFPRSTLPEDGFIPHPPVKEEYEEMSMDEVINGKVSIVLVASHIFVAYLYTGGQFPRTLATYLCLY
jgi:glutamate--cysteine ligase catalytic subunit